MSRLVISKRALMSKIGSARVGGRLGRRPAGGRLEDRLDGPAVVDDVEPVALLQAVAVDRDLPAAQDVRDHQRHQLLGELVGPVVVGAVGHADVHVEIRLHVGAHDLVAGGLGCAVGVLALSGLRSLKNGWSSGSSP